MKQEQRLINNIITNKKIETAEVFNYLITTKAREKLQEFKISLAKKLFNKS